MSSAIRNAASLVPAGTTGQVGNRAKVIPTIRTIRAACGVYCIPGSGKRISAPLTRVSVNTNPDTASSPKCTLTGIFGEVGEQTFRVRDEPHKNPGQHHKQRDKQSGEPGNRPKAGILNRRQCLQKACENSDDKQNAQQRQTEP